MSTPNYDLWEKLQGEIPKEDEPRIESWRDPSTGRLMQSAVSREDVLIQQRDAALELISRSANWWLRFSRFRYRVQRWRKQGVLPWKPIGRGGRQHG